MAARKARPNRRPTSSKPRTAKAANSTGRATRVRPRSTATKPRSPAAKAARPARKSAASPARRKSTTAAGTRRSASSSRSARPTPARAKQPAAKPRKPAAAAKSKAAPGSKKKSARKAPPAKKTAAAKKTPAVKAAPAAKKSQRQERALPPALTRERRQLVDIEPDDDAAQAPTDDRLIAAVRTGRQELEQLLRQHTETGPALSGGDIDARWDDAYAVGDEAPGGDNPTPDQDRVDDIGKALGVNYDDNEELRSSDKIGQRDRHRWELDPASSDDWPRKP